MAAGDITAVRIASAAQHNGWVAEVDVEGRNDGGTYDFGLGANNNPSTAKMVLTVQSPGYDATGAPTTIVRTLYGTQWVRQAYPNQAVADETEDGGGNVTLRIALSDFVYDDDVVTSVVFASGLYTSGSSTNAGTVLSTTNNSTLAHPKVIGRWAWPAFEQVQSDFLLEAVCFHRSALDGKPVAAVVFSVTDGSHTETVTVTQMTVSTRTGDANKVLVYAATVPISGFTQGSVLTANFTAYPWVGDSGSVLDSDNGITPPDERLCPLPLLCDKTGTYGEAFAVVDPTNGNASTASTWVASSQASAESAYAGGATNSYQTMTHALQAIQAYNNTNYSRNNPGGGTVLLVEATHSTASLSDRGAQDTWTTITKLSTASRANVIINGGANQTVVVRRLKYEDVSIEGSNAGQIRGSTSLSALWLDRCAINQTSTSGVYQFALAHGTRNSVAAFTVGFNIFGSNRCAWSLVRGNACAAATPAQVYTVIGNANVRLVFTLAGHAAGQQVSDNGVVAYNSSYGLTLQWYVGAAFANFTASHGLAIVQNVVESLSSTQELIRLWGDSSDTVANHVLLWHNTFAGQRLNIGYNDSGSTAYLRTNFSQRNNVLDEWNNKDDTFTTANAARTGSWPVGYNVGSAVNHKRKATNSEWKGEFFGLHNVDGGTLGFVDDNSHNNGGGGSGTGNGDYHLTSSASGYALVPAGYAVLPFDLEGTPRNNNGGGSAGAYEMNPPTAGGRRLRLPGSIGFHRRIRTIGASA